TRAFLSPSLPDDLPIYIQLVCGSGAGELAQTAQGDLDVAGAQLHLIIQVLVFALLPDLGRTTLALARVADTDTHRVVAAGAKRRSEEHTSELQSRENLV